MKLRRFTTEGIQVFREFLAESRREPKTEIPAGLLEHRTWTEVVTPKCHGDAHSTNLSWDDR